MLDIALHTGLEHPNVAWILIPSMLTFALGLGVGIYRRKIRAVFGLESTATSE